MPLRDSAFACFQVVSGTLEPQPPSVRAMSKVAGAAVALCLLLFLALSIASLVLFGEELHHNVLVDFTLAHIEPVLSSRWAAIAVVLGVRLAYLTAVVTTFPLTMQPMRCEAAVWYRGGIRRARLGLRSEITATRHWLHH